MGSTLRPALCALRSALGRPGACASAWAIFYFLPFSHVLSRRASASSRASRFKTQNPGGGVWMLRRQRLREFELAGIWIFLFGFYLGILGSGI